MEKEQEAADAKAVLFKRLYGVKPDAFEKMLSILQKEYNALHQKGGTPGQRRAGYYPEIPESLFNIFLAVGR